MTIAEALSHLPWILQAIIRLVVAAVLGGLIGLERERRGRSAGFRTQMLVALGATLAMLVSLQFVLGIAPRYELSASMIQVDPARVAYGVMGGIGFLGAGAILRYGVGVRGLTTAASLWCTAAVGLATGLGMFEIAAAATLIVLFVLYVLSRLDRHIPGRWYKQIKLVMDATQGDNPARVRTVLKDRGVRVVAADYARDLEKGRETLTFHISGTRDSSETLLAAVSELPGLHKVTFDG
ncbi:MAG: MgtC/SapB family protein [Phycisphaerae bacterium]|nr:MgtC/SapB family protein [Phycisphaerae bacterium]